MIPSFIELIICYGICFGLMNKATILHGRSEFTDRLLSCSYCTGFHCGWLWYALSTVLGSTVAGSWQVLVGTGIAYAFGASAFCYLADSASQLIEGWTPREEAEEAEETA